MMSVSKKFAPLAPALLLSFAAAAAAQQTPPQPEPTPTTTRRPVAPISGGVLNGKAISKPAPPYPAVAKAARASGTVVVQITVDEGGKVISAAAVSGHPLLRQAAVQAAYGARFSPTLLSGHPVKVTGTVSYNFVLMATAASDEKGRLVSLSNLGEGGGRCEIDFFVATIVSLELDADNKITGLNVRTERGRRLTVKLGAKLYRELPEEDVDKLGQLLAANLKVRLVVHDCSKDGGDVLVDDVRAAGADAPDPST